jgi:hypothetical protein
MSRKFLRYSLTVLAAIALVAASAISAAHKRYDVQIGSHGAQKKQSQSPQTIANMIEGSRIQAGK